MSRQGKLAALASTGVTKTELDNIDGGTARGTTAIADGDGVLINDAGTMRMTSVETLATYMGTKITGGSLVYLASSGALSNVATVSFTQFDSSKYDHYQIRFQHVIPVNDDIEFHALTSSNGGSSYDTGSTDYRTNSLAVGNSNGERSEGFLSSTGNIGSDANETGINLILDILSPHRTEYTMIAVSGGTMNTTASVIYGASAFDTGFVRVSSAVVNAIQFKFSSGNIESGEIVMYGIANGT